MTRVVGSATDWAGSVAHRAPHTHTVSSPSMRSCIGDFSRIDVRTIGLNRGNDDQGTKGWTGPNGAVFAAVAAITSAAFSPIMKTALTRKKPGIRGKTDASTTRRP